MAAPRVTILGDSLTAFAAALEFAEVGVSAQLHLPVGDAAWPESGATDARGEVAALIHKVSRPLSSGRDDTANAATSTNLERSEGPELWLHSGTGEGFGAVPEPQISGIPGSPLASEVTALTGSGFRGYLDRLLPVLTLGKTHGIMELATKRMGAAYADTLVKPVVEYRFGAPAEQVAVSSAAPGLNEAVTRAGSLSGGVLQLSDRIVERARRVEPAEGWPAFRERFLDRLRAYRVEIVETDTAELPLIANSIAPADGTVGAVAEIDETSQVLVVDGLTSATRVFGAANAKDTDAHDTVASGARSSEGPKLPPVRAVARAAVAAIPGFAPQKSAELLLGEKHCGDRTTASVTSSENGVCILEIRGPRGATDEISREIKQRVCTILNIQVPQAEAWTNSTVTAPPIDDADLGRTRTEVLRYCAAHPGVLLTGELWSGGSLSDALAAQQQPVLELRRKLTGIAR